MVAVAIRCCSSVPGGASRWDVAAAWLLVVFFCLLFLGKPTEQRRGDAMQCNAMRCAVRSRIHQSHDRSETHSYERTHWDAMTAQRQGSGGGSGGVVRMGGDASVRSASLASTPLCTTHRTLATFAFLMLQMDSILCQQTLAHISHNQPVAVAAAAPFASLPFLLPIAMSVAASSKKSKKAVVAQPADDVDMTEASDSVGEFVPSTQIGSYLSQNYNPEVESKKVPGFICGRQRNKSTTRAMGRPRKDEDAGKHPTCDGMEATAVRASSPSDRCPSRPPAACLSRLLVRMCVYFQSATV